MVLFVYISYKKTIFIHFRVSAAYLCWVFHSSEHDEEIESSSCFMLMLCSKNSRSTLMLLPTTDHMRTRETNKCNTRLFDGGIFTRLHFPSIRWHARRPMIIISPPSTTIVVVSSCVPNSDSIPSAFTDTCTSSSIKISEKIPTRKHKQQQKTATQTRPHDSHGNVLRRYYFSFKIRVLVFVDVFYSIHFCLWQAHVRLTRNIKLGD